MLPKDSRQGRQDHGSRRRSLFVSVEQLDTIGTYTAISSIISSLLLLLYLNVADQASVVYFHLVYLLTLGFLSAHLAISAILGKSRLAVLTTVSVMVCLGLLSTAAAPYPIISSTDVKFELQNVNVILSMGVVPWGQGTGFAPDYTYFPGLEIIVSVLSLVSLIPPVVLMKYAGSFLGIITIMLFLRVYSRACGQQACGLAAALAALSPWFVAFDAFMVHQTLALLFLGMILLSLGEPKRREWMFVALLGTGTIAITHAFTSILLIFSLVLLAATDWLHSRRKTSAALPNLTGITTLAATLVVVSWDFFAGVAYWPDVFAFLRAATDSLFAPELILRTLAISQSTGIKPFWVFVLTAVGLATYFSIAFGMFVRAMLRRNARNRSEVPLALAGFLISGGLLVPYLAGLSVSPDLQGRAFIYLYFLTAPLVARFLVGRLAGVTHIRLGFRLSRGAILTAGLILVILVPVMYYGVSPGIYDRSSPIVFPGDIRLSLGEWQAAACFSREKISVSVVYGVILARDFVGALGGKEVYFAPRDGTLLEWIQQHPRELLFLRVSIIHTPDFAHVSKNDLLSTFDHSDVLYSSGDVVILIAR